MLRLLKSIFYSRGSNYNAVFFREQFFLNKSFYYGGYNVIEMYKTPFLSGNVCDVHNIGSYVTKKSLSA